ncbi:MAG: A/G-specific adenine glycosylase [Lachnospiraceae bacterium]
MLENIVDPLLQWYDGNKRSLPWREEPSAYHVWVSEIMLQQTRVEAVKPYYKRFMQSLPDVKDLAVCPENKLLKLWEGLGYYNRVKNMQKAAVFVMEHYGGSLPADYEALLELPGIGSYTAGAIASIAFGIPRPAVDGNVLRVISRVTEQEEDILKQSVKRKMEDALTHIMPAERPGDFNQSLMELGATVCIPNGMAKCDSCPLKKLCLAKAHDRVMELPVKKAKKERRIEEKTILLIQNQEEFAIHKRPAQGLLAGLYEYPGIDGFCTQQEIIDYVESLGMTPLRVQYAGDAKHIFSHVEWRMKGYVVRIAGIEKKRIKGMTFVSKKEAKENYPIPSAFRAYRKYIEED